MRGSAVTTKEGICKKRVKIFRGGGERTEKERSEGKGREMNGIITVEHKEKRIHPNSNSRVKERKKNMEGEKRRKGDILERGVVSRPAESPSPNQIVPPPPPPPSPLPSTSLSKKSKKQKQSKN